MLAWEGITGKVCKEDFDANSLAIDIERVKEAMHEASVADCNSSRILSRAKIEIGIDDSRWDVWSCVAIASRDIDCVLLDLHLVS